MLTINCNLDLLNNRLHNNTENAIYYVLIKIVLLIKF